MWFVSIGTLLLLLKAAEIGPFGALSWWWVMLPFGLAVVWWSWADSSGWTKQREVNKMEQKKQVRRQKAMEALGLDWRRDRRVKVIKSSRKAEAQRQEADREAQRQARRAAEAKAVKGASASESDDDQVDTRHLH